MNYLRTDDSCFDKLEAYNFLPNYLMVDDTEGGQLRVHFIDEGPKDGALILLMHGEPSWSYLYRKMIPVLVSAGFRVIAPDLIGFGRSDKPTQCSDYTYKRHVDWMHALLNQLQLSNITLFCQDWGGLIGLRLVAEQSERFSGVVAANTMLPTGEHSPGEAFSQWQKFSQEVPEFPAGNIINSGTTSVLSAEIIAAYDAPYPEEKYKAGARQFPLLVPTSIDDPATQSNLAAWKILRQWHKPFLTAFSDSDPITAGGDKIMQKLIPGTKGQAHTTIVNAGHFLQEDQGEQLAQVVIKFIKDNGNN
ncbi:MAG: haloalkane dehalogenase [Cognaticolwellia sp.]|jgi:haloalkane dehalogenase|tara:strand:- start:6490 stop:7404 length:915 start_codon:yes stop_codon:yes gene_type:complete